jgi:hypothetical protein
MTLLWFVGVLSGTVHGCSMTPIVAASHGWSRPHAGAGRVNRALAPCFQAAALREYDQPLAPLPAQLLYRVPAREAS